MPFDIHQPIFDDDGECEEAEFQAYVEAFIDAFRASPEGAALPEVDWVDSVAEYARTYFSATLASLQPGEFDEIVWEIFPRKVSVDPAEGTAIVRELRAFWAFVGREYGLEQAASCLRVVGDGAEARLTEYLGDPRRFGMAKGFFMAGKDAGFDMTSEAGIQTWAAAYNGGLAMARETEQRRRDDKDTAARKAKRKREKAARKKARR